MKALVVEDDPVLADLVAFTLRRQGFEVAQVYDGEAALQRWREWNPDLVILDLKLPRRDGFQVCRAIRQEQEETAIIMLTARTDEDDMIEGLGIGADDYITKPFSPRQLVARVRAVMRRAGKPARPAKRQVGNLQLDPARREVRSGSAPPVALTSLENRLLDNLMANAGQVMSPDSIINYVWGVDGADRDMLRQLIKRLRGKIEPERGKPVYIETVPGMGYGLVVVIEE